MKNILTIAFFFLAFATNAQEKKQLIKEQVVEVSCGQCKFAMKDKKGCDLAARIDGKSYFLDGTKLDDHGDAHAADGFCSVIRKAKVTGVIENNRLIVSAFTLLPIEKEKR